jgi:L-serine dehydratase
MVPLAPLVSAMALQAPSLPALQAHDAGLAGLRPEACDPQRVRAAWAGLTAEGTRLTLVGRHKISIRKEDVSFEPRTHLPGHPNALTLSGWGQGDGLPLFEQTCYSIGVGSFRQDGDPIDLRPAAAQPMA